MILENYKQLNTLLFNVLKTINTNQKFPFTAKNDNVYVVVEDGMDEINTNQKLFYYTNQTFTTILKFEKQLKNTAEFKLLTSFIIDNYICVYVDNVKCYFDKTLVDTTGHFKETKNSKKVLGMDTYK